MNATQKKLFDEMNAAYVARHEACQKYKEACKAFVESAEKTPEFMEQWKWLEAEEGIELKQKNNGN
ncbi:hypothetical protein KCM76_22475 [Zooshikella marina]|uniref:Uncharacterized protein n=1 Tax=Zooshikella ganghwensis TaxID=202772 RepID=A0A4P9VEI2_9GAMM|nr:hypothetical protein [Zooshikella ganghwensis]MBU2708776.1 hypothetical protein [Zooshikella ganghwensis]RDH41465.1 hypothetical protein B9G39_28015 [Zooshikella ganghwensis]RDH41571.1 hypothetical protein B9G39_27880 [Zooshikella ganghwensis]